MSDTSGQKLFTIIIFVRHPDKRKAYEELCGYKLVRYTDNEERQSVSFALMLYTQEKTISFFELTAYISHSFHRKPNLRKSDKKIHVIYCNKIRFLVKQTCIDIHACIYPVIRSGSFQPFTVNERATSKQLLFLFVLGRTCLLFILQAGASL